MRASARLLAIRLRRPLSTAASRSVLARVAYLCRSPRLGRCHRSTHRNAVHYGHSTALHVVFALLQNAASPPPGLLPFPFPSPLPCHQTGSADVAASTDLSAFEVLRL